METMHYVGKGGFTKGQILYGERQVRIDRDRRRRGLELSRDAAMPIRRSNKFPPADGYSSQGTSCVILIFDCRKVVSNGTSSEVETIGFIGALVRPNRWPLFLLFL